MAGLVEGGSWSCHLASKHETCLVNFFFRRVARRLYLPNFKRPQLLRTFALRHVSSKVSSRVPFWGVLEPKSRGACELKGEAFKNEHFFEPPS